LRKAADGNAAAGDRLARAAADYKRVVFPAHNYKHAPVVKFAQEVIRLGPDRHGALGHLEHLPHHACQGRQGVDTDGGATRDLGRRHRHGHGSHSFYLTFAWLDRCRRT